MARSGLILKMMNQNVFLSWCQITGQSGVHQSWFWWWIEGGLILIFHLILVEIITINDEKSKLIHLSTHFWGGYICQFQKSLGKKSKDWMPACVKEHIKYPMQLFNWLLSPVSWWKKKDAKSNSLKFEENEFISVSPENIVSFPTFLKSNNVESCNIRNSFFVYILSFTEIDS